MSRKYKGTWKKVSKSLLISSLIGLTLTSTAMAGVGDLSFDPDSSTGLASNHGLYIDIKTSDVKYAGTDGDVYFCYTTRDGKVTDGKTKSLDSSGNNFEQNDLDQFNMWSYGLPKNTHLWDFKTIGFTFDPKGAGSDWHASSMYIYYGKNGKQVGNAAGKKTTQNMWLKTKTQTMYSVADGIDTQIKISNLDGFDFSGDIYINPKTGSVLNPTTSNRYPSWDGEFISSNYGILKTFSPNLGLLTSKSGIIIDASGTTEEGNPKNLGTKQDEYLNIQKKDQWNIGYSLGNAEIEKFTEFMNEARLNKFTISVDPGIGADAANQKKLRADGKANNETSSTSAVALNGYVFSKAINERSTKNIIMTQFTFVDDIYPGTGSTSSRYSFPQNSNTKLEADPDLNLDQNRYFYNSETNELEFRVVIGNPYVSGYKNWNNYDVDEIGKNMTMDRAVLDIGEISGKGENAVMGKVEKTLTATGRDIRYDEVTDSMCITFDISANDIKNVKGLGCKLTLVNPKSGVDDNNYTYYYAATNGPKIEVQDDFSMIFSNHIVDTQGIEFEVDVENPDTPSQNITFNLQMEDSDDEPLEFKGDAKRTFLNSGYFYYVTLMDGNEPVAPNYNSVNTLKGSSPSSRMVFKLNNNVISSMYPTESVDRMKITMFDEAYNKTEQIVSVNLDKLAPRMELTQEETFTRDNEQKRLDIEFDITDKSGATLYYCFVPNGKSLPARPTGVITESPSNGVIDSLTPTWYQLDAKNTNIGSTVSILVNQGESKAGKLYYYAVDDAGNDSFKESKKYGILPYNVNYEIAEINLHIQGDYKNYPSSYLLYLSANGEKSLSYYWEGYYDHDDDPSTPEIKVATKPVEIENHNVSYNVGDESTTAYDSKGEVYQFDKDGLWTIHCTSISEAGNPYYLSQSLIFDNEGPEVTIREGNDAPEPSAYFQIQMVDKSNIRSYTYQVMEREDYTSYVTEKVTVNDVNELAHSTSLTFDSLETGVYQLKVVATDIAYNDTEAWSEPFYIRTKAPSIEVISPNTLNEGVHWITNDEDYQLQIALREEAENIHEFVDHQFVSYRTTVRDAQGNTIQGDWISKDADGELFKLGMVDGKVYLRLPIDTEFGEGINTLTIELRYTVSNHDSQSIYSHEILVGVDGEGPVYRLDLERARDKKTPEAVYGNILVYDNYTSREEITYENNLGSMLMERVIDDSNIFQGVHSLTFTNTTVGDISFKDNALNETLVPINVDDVDTIPPTIRWSIYDESVGWVDYDQSSDVPFVASAPTVWRQDADGNGVDIPVLNAQEIEISYVGFLPDTVEMKLFDADGNEVEDMDKYLSVVTSTRGEGQSGRPSGATNRFGEIEGEMMCTMVLTALEGDYYVIVSMYDAADNYSEARIEFNDMVITPITYDYTVAPTNNGRTAVDVTFNDFMTVFADPAGIAEADDELTGKRLFNVMRNAYMDSYTNDYRESTPFTKTATLIAELEAGSFPSYTLYAFDYAYNMTKIEFTPEVTAEVKTGLTLGELGLSPTLTIYSDQGVSKAWDTSTEDLVTFTAEEYRNLWRCVVEIPFTPANFSEQALLYSEDDLQIIGVLGTTAWDYTEKLYMSMYPTPISQPGAQDIYYYFKTDAATDPTGESRHFYGKMDIEIQGEADMTPPEMTLALSTEKNARDVSLVINATDESSYIYVNSLDRDTEETFSAGFDALSADKKTGISKIEIIKAWDESEKATYVLGADTLDGVSYQTYDSNTGGLYWEYPVDEKAYYTVRVYDLEGNMSESDIKVENLLVLGEEDSAAGVTMDDIRVTYTSDGVPIDPNKFYSKVTARIDGVHEDYNGEISYYSLVEENENSYINEKYIQIVNNTGSAKQDEVELNNVLDGVSNVFKFELTDYYGNTLEVPVSFDKFDTELPKITKPLTPSTTEPIGIEQAKTFNLSFIATDNNGIANITVKKDGAVYKSTDFPVPLKNADMTIGKLAEQECFENGVYRVVVTDVVGNTSESIYQVLNIDSKAPHLYYYLTPSVYARDKVKVNLTYNINEDVTIHSVEYYKSGTNEPHDPNVFIHEGNTVTVTENGTMKVRYYDAAGNAGKDAYINVTNIHRDPPPIIANANVSTDLFSADISFQMTSTPDDEAFDDLSDYTVFFNGDDQKANNVFTVSENGVYYFDIVDIVKNFIRIEVTVSGIDKEAPVIEAIKYTYDYSYYNGEDGTYTHTGTHEVGDEVGYTIALFNEGGSEVNYVTKGEVAITVTTDTPTSFVGGSGEASTENTIIFDDSGNGLYTLEKGNTKASQYELGVYVIDTVAPELTGINDLVFYENTKANKEPYSKNMVEAGFEAWDVFPVGIDTFEKDGVNYNGELLTEKVEIIYETVYYGDEAYTFDPDNLTNNKFDAKKPYYITYRVYDKAGNMTEVRRKITLVGFHDAVVLVNGQFPDSSNSVVLPHDTEEIVIEMGNTGSKVYARLAKNYAFTMGQIKTNGVALEAVEGNDKKFVVQVAPKEKSGDAVVPENQVERDCWNTAYLQTTMADYFTINIFVEAEPINKTYEEGDV